MIMGVSPATHPTTSCDLESEENKGQCLSWVVVKPRRNGRSGETHIFGYASDILSPGLRKKMFKITVSQCTLGKPAKLSQSWLIGLCDE